MGNYNFKVNPPQPGQLCVIIDTPYTSKEKFPQNVYGQNSKVKVIGSKDLMCSRPDAPKVTCSLVQFANGNRDVYFSNSLRPI
jgi:hypothetical protein